MTKSDTSKFIKNAQSSGDMVPSMKADDKQSSVQMKRLLEAQTILTDENSDQGGGEKRKKAKITDPKMMRI